MTGGYRFRRRGSCSSYEGLGREGARALYFLFPYSFVFLFSFFFVFLFLFLVFLSLPKAYGVMAALVSAICSIRAVWDVG